ncbi:MAG: hypothetical protein IJ242_07880 [Clostridia bacterium]|nr:hypothetical protein [Clostridia bacterium]
MASAIDTMPKAQFVIKGNGPALALESPIMASAIGTVPKAQFVIKGV